MLGHMVNQFALAPRKERIPSSRFDRSSQYTSAFDASYLIPFYCEEIYPGDIFKVDTSLFCRLSTPVVPILDNLYCDTFWFFVPNRLVWSNWAKFMGEQENPGDSTDYLVPAMDIPEGGFALESIYDYFGLPILVSDGRSDINVIPLRMYNLIWNEWFRDENLQDSVVVRKSDGGDLVSDFNLLRRNKKKDFFTSLLPTPQKFEGVSISLGTTRAPVFGIAGEPLKFRPFDDNSGAPSLDTQSYLRLQNTNNTLGVSNANFYSTQTALNNGKNVNVVSEAFLNEHSATGMRNSGLEAVIDDLSPISITTLRYASILQKFRELQNRGGTRLTETIRTMFGVISPDARLQRPELLGSSSSLFSINPVAQTSSTDSVSPQGNLSAYGVMSSTQIGFRRSFTEHGFVIGLVMVKSDVKYQQGLHKMWQRRQMTDYYWPLFNGLSEMAVFKSQLMFSSDYNENISVLGYQERFSELRYKESVITGKMRSIAPTSLDVWHTAQYFESVGLNSEFIQDGTKEVLKRVLAVEDEPQIIFDAYFREFDTRPLPTHSIPGMGASL